LQTLSLFYHSFVILFSQVVVEKSTAFEPIDSGHWSCNLSQKVLLSNGHECHPLIWVPPQSGSSNSQKLQFPSCQCVAIYGHHNGDHNCPVDAVGCCVECMEMCILGGILPANLEMRFYCAVCVHHEHHYYTCEDGLWREQNPHCKLYSADVDYTPEMIKDMEVKRQFEWFVTIWRWNRRQ
jgi:hypothetical protein